MSSLLERVREVLIGQLGSLKRRDSLLVLPLDSPGARKGSLCVVGAAERVEHLASEYAVEREIASGGMGVVFFAHDALWRTRTRRYVHRTVALTAGGVVAGASLAFIMLQPRAPPPLAPTVSVAVEPLKLRGASSIPALPDTIGAWLVRNLSGYPDFVVRGAPAPLPSSGSSEIVLSGVVHSAADLVSVELRENPRPGGVGAVVADLIAFDTDRFESHVGAHDWRAAAELVGGEFMEGLAVPDAPLFEDWLSSERLSWRHRSVDALGKLASEAFATGDLATAAKAGQRALALDPTSDRAVRVAMRAAALADDRKGALARYERFEHHLEEAGGSTPAAETKSLADRIRSDRKWRLPTYVVQAGSRGAESRRAPLVGRGNELSALLSGETCRGNGKASLAVIRAGSGLGKTRLVDEIVARARLEGAALSTFHAVPADEASPLAGLIGLAQGGLIDAGGLAAAHAGALGALAGKLGEWAERFPNVNSEVEAWTLQDAFWRGR